MIEALFAVRKNNFKSNIGIIPDLDLVEPDDQITHSFDLMDPMEGDEKLNIFIFDPHF